HALGAPDEDGIGVRCVDDVGDLRSGLLGTLLPVVCGVDEDTEVVEEWPLRAVRLAAVKLEICAGHLDPRSSVQRGCRTEAERQPVARVPFGIGRNECDMVD